MSPESSNTPAGQAEALWAAGGRADALALWATACKQSPRDLALLARYAAALREVGQIEVAVRVGHQAVQRRPDAAEAYEILAAGLEMRGQFAKSAAAYKTALRLRPGDPDLHRRLGLSCGHAGQYDQARAAFSSESRLRPAAAQPCIDIGSLWEREQRYAEAEVAYREAITREPANAAGWRWVGVMLGRQGKIKEGVPYLQKAAALEPGNAMIWHDLAVSCGKVNMDAQAEAAHRQAVALDAGNPRYLQSLAQHLQDIGRLDEGIAAAGQVLAMDPGNTAAHGTLAMAYLAQGRLAEGFAEYEWRWDAPDFPEKKRAYAQPAWRGENLRGRRLLVYSEQGNGDMIQFLRYVPLLADRGAEVIVEVPPALVGLARTLRGVGEVIEKGSTPPGFDMHCAMLSLAQRLGTTAETIPAAVPYLQVSAELRERWGQRVRALCPDGRRVGVVWAGSKRHSHDRHRSCSLEALLPLAEVPGVRWCSLQMGEPSRERKKFPGMIDLMEGVRDFADTAAILQHMDLVITVDTSVAHLAGALGRPVWVLLAERADWRWMVGREDTPWYPTMRLFRRGAGEDWAAVVERVRRLIDPGVSAPRR